MKKLIILFLFAFLLFACSEKQESNNPVDSADKTNPPRYNYVIEIVYMNGHCETFEVMNFWYDNFNKQDCLNLEFEQCGVSIPQVSENVKGWQIIERRERK